MRIILTNKKYVMIFSEKWQYQVISNSQILWIMHKLFGVTVRSKIFLPAQV
jgi:hypothetical protein